MLQALLAVLPRRRELALEIKELIEEAYKKSGEFRFKYSYWVIKRKKQPDLNWLMDLLEKALGTEYVREQARKHIEKREI